MTNFGCCLAALTGTFLLSIEMDSNAQSSGEPFTELLDGSLREWHVENSDGSNFEIRGEVLHVSGPEGWLRSQRQYADFDLDVQFRFLTDDADSGVFFRAVGKEPFIRGWPNQSYQLQMLNPIALSRFPPLGGLFRHGMPDGETNFDEALARQVTRATGEWQRLQIEVIGEQVRARINGTPVLEASGIGNVRGYIGLQGETDSLEFRSVKIRSR